MDCEKFPQGRVVIRTILIILREMPFLELLCAKVADTQCAMSYADFLIWINKHALKNSVVQTEGVYVQHCYFSGLVLTCKRNLVTEGSLHFVDR